MDKPDSSSGPRSADAIALYQQPPFDSNTRWYDEYLTMMRRANAILLDEVKALRYAEDLHGILSDILTETDGGNFLSQETRSRAQALLRYSFTPPI